MGPVNALLSKELFAVIHHKEVYRKLSSLTGMNREISLRKMLAVEQLNQNSLNDFLAKIKKFEKEVVGMHKIVTTLDHVYNN